jgi:chromosome segregation ATPase
LAEKNQLLDDLNGQFSESERYLYEEKSKSEQHNIVLARKDNEFSDLRRILEEKLEEFQAVQLEKMEISGKFKAVREKRENGLREIKKLRKKIDDMADDLKNNNTQFMKRSGPWRSDEH